MATPDAIHLALKAVKRPLGSKLKWTVLDDGRVRLDIIRVRETRQGHGTKLLNEVLALSDELGFEMELLVDPTDTPGDPDTATLMRWYQKHGFRHVGACMLTLSPKMVRVPKSRHLAS